MRQTDRQKDGRIDRRIDKIDRQKGQADRRLSARTTFPRDCNKVFFFFFLHIIQLINQNI